MMKKNSIRLWVVWAVLIVVYHVIIFAVPFEKNGVFYLSWAFTLIAMVAQIYVFRVAFLQGESARSKFYGFPISKIGFAYLLIQLAAGLGFMALGWGVTTPLWIPLILYVVLLGASVIGFVAADATRDEITRQDVKLKKDVSCMRALQSKITAILGQARDDSVKEAVEKFADALRYSDPVSSAALEEIESELTGCLDEIQRAVIDEDNASALTLLGRANTLLLERNRLCKLNKAERN